jgi:hypothetical protein
MAPLSLFHPPYWVVLIIVVYFLVCSLKALVLALSEHPVEWLPTPAQRTRASYRAMALFDAAVVLYVAALLVVHL